MKISLEWLAEFLPGPLTGDAAAEALTHGGLPVEVIERHGDDTVIDVEVTSNRGDCLSHRGIGRELAALLDRQFTDRHPIAAESATAASSAVGAQIDASALCPHYTARVIRGVKIGPSPAWLIRRLDAVGLRAVNNVVDVTNYVLFELGQPLHAFDFDKLAGGRIIVRTAAGGETIVSLDGHERQLTPGMLVIADAKRPVALAGVMGGRDSEVSAGTVNVLLESARFDPLSVRKTARSLAMKSDSSYRFERGIDPLLPVYASLRAAQLILQIAGGELLGGIVEAGNPGHTPKRLVLRAAKLRSVLGTDLPEAQVTAALARLRFNPIQQPDGWSVSVPSYRLDINLEIDLVEEVARAVGYDKIPVRDEISIRLTPPDPALKAISEIRTTLAACGYFEAITVSFVSDALADVFVGDEGIELLRADESVRKADARVRSSMLPGLLESIGRNEAAGTLDARLFEIGSVFRVPSRDALQEERRVAWVGGDVRDVRGALEVLLEHLNPAKAIRITRARKAGFDDAAAARIEWGQEYLGHMGLASAALCDLLSLRQRPAMVEIDLRTLLAGFASVHRLNALPRFPAVWRDISVVVPAPCPYQDIELLVTSLRMEHLESVDFVGTYRGKQLEKSQKSITLRLTFRSPTATLTGAEIGKQMQHLEDELKVRINALVRV